jgi:hypothetical protein
VTVTHGKTGLAHIRIADNAHLYVELCRRCHYSGVLKESDRYNYGSDFDEGYTTCKQEQRQSIQYRHWVTDSRLAGQDNGMI